MSDVAITAGDAKFALPETGLGVIPAQIAPFVVQRIGLTRARRIALTGQRFDGHHALTLGVVHASRATKQLVLDVGHVPMDELLDRAADDFAQAVASEEGQEGTLAFVQKRPPAWAADE